MNAKRQGGAQGKGISMVAQLGQRNRRVMKTRAAGQGFVGRGGIMGGLSANLRIIGGDVVGVSLVVRKVAGLVKDQVVRVIDRRLKKFTVGLAVIAVKGREWPLSLRGRSGRRGPGNGILHQLSCQAGMVAQADIKPNRIRVNTHPLVVLAVELVPVAKIILLLPKTAACFYDQRDAQADGELAGLK